MFFLLCSRVRVVGCSERALVQEFFLWSSQVKVVQLQGLNFFRGLSVEKCGNMLFNCERDTIHKIMKMHILFPPLHSSAKWNLLLVFLDSFFYNLIPLKLINVHVIITLKYLDKHQSVRKI